MKTTKDDLEKYYLCGQCGEEIYHLATDTPPSTCPYCGWKHQAKDKDSVPSEFKTSLNQFG